MSRFYISVYLLLAFSFSLSISGMEAAIGIGLLAWPILRRSRSYENHANPIPKLTALALLFLMISPLPSMLHSPDLAVSLPWLRRHLFLFVIPLTALTAWTVRKHVLPLARMYAAASIVAGGYAVLQAFFGEQLNRPFRLDTYYTHATGFFSMPNTLAESLTFSILALVALVFVERKRLYRTASMIGIFIVFWGILFSRSRTPIVVSTVAVAVLLIALFKRRGLLVIAGILILVSAVHLTNNRIFWRFRTFQTDRAERFPLWRQAGNAFLQNPVTGCGVGNFREYLQRHVHPEHRHLVRFNHAHSNLLDTAATTGLIGLIALLGFWTVVIWDIYRTFRRTQSPEARAILLTALAGIIAFHLEGLTECNLKDAEVALQLYVWTGLFYGFRTTLEGRAQTATPDT